MAIESIGIFYHTLNIEWLGNSFLKDFSSVKINLISLVKAMNRNKLQQIVKNFWVKTFNKKKS